MDEPEIEELFYIDYRQQVAKMGARTRREEKQTAPESL